MGEHRRCGWFLLVKQWKYCSLLLIFCNILYCTWLNGFLTGKCTRVQFSWFYDFSLLFSLLSCPDITIYKYETKTNIGIVLVVVISSNIYEIFLETWHHWHADNVVLQVVISDQTLSQVSICWCQHDIVLTQSQHLLINWIFLDQTPTTNPLFVLRNRNIKVSSVKFISLFYTF